jgi:[CysO sulfur-carrier protein]-S-L-cysteine hydrolase
VRADQSEPAATGSDARVPEVIDWQRAADSGHLRRGNGPTLFSSADIPKSLLDQVIEWSLRGRPNEACGLIAGTAPAADGGIATRFLPLTNAAASPYRYLIDADEQLRAMLDIDDADEMVWGIVHSHVSSLAAPSDTDVGLAAYPDALYLICSLAADPAHVRAWSIQAGAVHEVDLQPV